MDPPSRYFVKTLSFFIEDSKRAEKLKEFASKTSVRNLETYLFAYRKGKVNTTDIVSEKREISLKLCMIFMVVVLKISNYLLLI